jgi:hypothetical protein
LPDILGVRTGMTADQAVAALKAYDPKAKLEMHNDAQRVVAHDSQGAADIIDFWFTPNEPHLVTKVTRDLTTNKPAPLADVIAQVRQKYGPEIMQPGAAPASAAGFGGTWLFDEQGRRYAQDCHCKALKLSVGVTALPAVQEIRMLISNPWLVDQSAKERSDNALEQRKRQEQEELESSKQNKVPRL